MKSINSCVSRQKLPVRAVQFGEGNFLRAFVDHMLDIANEQGAFSGRVAVVKPRRGSIDKFIAQDCLYTVVLRGREQGKIVNEHRIVTVLDSVHSPYDDPDCLARLGCIETLEYVISNTTEAGIALTGSEQPDDRPCESFPGKLLQLLWARYQHFSGDPARGVVVLPTELIDKNGQTLLTCLLTLAGRWNLPAEFTAWLQTACTFCNTLVDRIVTGFPAEADALQRELGYEDALLDVGEPFGLWVIECPDPEALSARLPLGRIGLPVVYTRDLTPYRERKVRILNGAHTSSVLAAYLAGEEIVRGMMNNPLTRAFVDRAVFDELLPTVPLPAEEVRAFAGAVMERFDNPFIDHKLLAISLNSVSKWRARVLPALKDTVLKTGRVPQALAFSLAALIAFYTPASRDDGGLTGLREGCPYPIRDSEEVLDFFWEHRGSTFSEAFVRLFLSRTDFWGEDLNGIAGLCAETARWLGVIRTEGMKSALFRAAQA